jgi:phosphoribosyl 1,2-cyclic phosphodiesterase
MELRADGELIILDAGTGIRPLGLVLNEEFKNESLHATLLISHTHWDHIQGFPFFRPAYNSKNRIHILGYEGAKRTLSTVLSGQMASPYFPVALEQMQGSIVIEELKEMQFSIGPIKGSAIMANHPGVAVGYRLETSSGSIVYLPDHEPSACSEECNSDAASEIDNRLVEFARGADVLIIDSQYDDEEYAEHVGWGHGCVSVVVKIAIAAGVRRLYLFHHDPNHSDEQVSYILHQARRLAATLDSQIEIEAAREGEEFIL